MKFKVSNDFEYRTLPGVFYFFTLSGAWCPNDWSPFSKSFYTLYTIYQGSLALSICLATGINLIVANVKSGRFFENVFHFAALSLGLQKCIFVRKNTKMIKRWMQKFFNDKWYEPRDQYESKILENYRLESRYKIFFENQMNYYNY